MADIESATRSRLPPPGFRLDSAPHQYEEGFVRDIFDDENDDTAASDFAEMFENSLTGIGKKLSPGDKVRGEILTIGKEEVFVSTGTVDDGAVLKSDLLDAEGQFHHKVGDFLNLFVTQVRGGQILLSPKPTSKNMAEGIEDAFDMMLPVEGKVTELCNGGFRVTVMGKSAFCPVSQMDSRRIDNQEAYIGKKFEFLVTQFSERGRNIVVSRRKLLDEQKEISVQGFLEDHKVGDALQGVVTRVEKFGAFIEVAPGLEGLAHISELAWSRTDNPSEVVHVGQELSVKILKLDEANGRLQVSLSVKQAQPEPWLKLPSHLREGAVVQGKITRCMKFGAFVELAPGIEGLVPMSEMTYGKRVVRSDEIAKEGEVVQVLIKEISPDDRRMVLSLRDAAGSDPWIMAESRFQPGTVAQGVIDRREPYGLFVRLDEGLVGLMPKSKANDNPDFSYDKAKVGDQVVVQIDEFRGPERKISLKVPLDPGAGNWQGFQSGQGTKSQSIGTLAEQFTGLFQGAPSTGKSSAGTISKQNKKG